ncbi:MAG: SurA N-terminal domain-containing protein [Hyphomicrobiales bacterium]|jgi:peptidyl-prolyl cis-trans isomerase D|nr:SurA N-terminal domain-containing protein [Hyphomicrobiales bacterium]|tara:strand:- start:229 stop:2133 length:1905 start_codon:yes stop_codon:yes gene_type:complete
MLDLLRRNASGPFGLTLIILLVLAFSVWGIGDIFRNYDVGTLARIGDREVDSQEFLFRYNREINRISNELERFVSNEEARDSGIDIQILTNLLVEKTLNSSADEMKLRPSDNSLTERLKNTSSFRNAFNQFDKNVFNQVLRQNGITEDLFFSMERDSIAQAQIYRALFENLNISKEFSNLIHRFQNEDRSVDYLVLNTNTENVDPYEINNQELLSYYNNNKDNYKSESKRDFTLLTLLKSEISSLIEVEEEIIKEIYENNLSDYETPEKRTYYVIPFNSSEEVNSALNNFKENTDINNIIVSRGLSVEDVLQSSISLEEGLNEAISNKAFEVDKNILAGPVQGPFGPTLIYVTKIESSLKKTFLEVKEKIEQDYKSEETQDKIYEIYNVIEDQRAAGLTFEEIALENNLKLSQYSSVNDNGSNFSNSDIDLALRNLIIETIFDSDIGLEMDPLEDQNGNVVFIRVDNIDEETILNFDNVQNEVRSDIINQRQKKDLEDISFQYLNDINNNINNLEQIADNLNVAILKRDNLSRYSFDEVFSRSAIEEIFKTNVNKAFKANVGIGDSIIIGMVTKISIEEQKEADIEALNQRNEDNLKNELLIILSEELQKELSSEVYPERLDFLFETINTQGSF